MAGIKGRKILICDDDKGILEVTRIILESNGYLVETLDNGRSIVKKVEQINPDLILLDLKMPGIEGKEITGLLRKAPSTKDIPIVIISAASDLDEIIKSVQVNGVLAKPFDMDELLERVGKLARRVKN